MKQITNLEIAPDYPLQSNKVFEQHQFAKVKEKELVFELGLVMAGAVSAGAYTAGVIDFLMDALEAWEKIKQAEKHLPVDQRTVPYHTVRIKVIASASAGGMAGAMLAVKIRNKALGIDNPSIFLRYLDK